MDMAETVTETTDYVGVMSPEQFDKSYKRLESDFRSKGIRCSGWLCLPDGVVKPPVLVMAHGFSGLKDWLLDYPARFLQKGIAVYLFDYRSWGDSDGEPRQWTSRIGQLQDWKAAIAHVRALEEVDGSNLAIWGASYSGGHVIDLASKDPEIAAVIAEVPVLDAYATFAGIPMKNAAKVLVAGWKDVFRWIRGHEPLYIPVFAEPWEPIAVLQAPGISQGFADLVPPWSNWSNAVVARSVVEFALHRPVMMAPKVKCPVLFISSKTDAFATYKTVEKVVPRMANAELITLEMDHLEVFMGEALDRLLDQMADFLVKTLKPEEQKMPG